MKRFQLLSQFLLLLVVIGMFHSSAIAKERKKKVAKSAKRAPNSEIETKIGVAELPISNVKWMYGAVDLGFSSLNTDATGEVNKNGLHFNLKAVTQLYSYRKFAFDLGLGWFHNRNNGTSNGNTVKVSTSGFLTELPVRYRLTPRWQVGLLTQGVFGSDLSFSEGIGTNGFALFTGPMALYELPLHNRRLRFGLQFLTDLNVSNRQIYFAQAFFQIGFPFRFGQSDQPLPVPKEETIPSEGESVRIRLDSRAIAFRPGSADLSPEARRYLMDLGEYLARNQLLWESVHVEGHTDPDGSERKNMAVSKERAERVMKTLVFYGVSAKRVSHQGLGSTQPLRGIASQSSTGWKRLRRIELEFQGVTNVILLKEGLLEIYRKHFGTSGANKG